MRAARHLLPLQKAAHRFGANAMLSLLLGIGALLLSSAVVAAARVPAPSPERTSAPSPATAAEASSASAATKQGGKPVLEQGVRWRDMKPVQQNALRPLEREWAGIDAPRKQKWLELSTRFSTLSPTEQARVQERMAEWARLTPLQRGDARLNFQQAKQLPAADRQARWDAYQALSPEQKQQFAARATRPVAAASEAQRRPANADGRTEAAATREPVQTKSNIVPNPALTAGPRAIGPTVVQARPGVTTTLVTKRPMPPSHQQVGLPKIAATPGFVDKSTLLPQRGPQGAATHSAAAPASEAAIRQ